MSECQDLQTRYRDMIEPELNFLHVWLDNPDSWIALLPVATAANLGAQSGVLQLIEWDRRLTLLEERLL